MFVEQGRKGVNSFYLYILTILLCISGMISFARFIMDHVHLIDGDKNQLLLLNLLPFAFVLFVLFMNIKLLHKRSVSSLINIFTQFRLKRFLVSFGIWFFGMLIIDFLYWYFFNGAYVMNVHWDKFLSLLFISISLFPVQTLAEELFFRSYIMQGLSNIFSRAIFPVVISSILFMLVHLANPEIGQFGLELMIGFYFLNGVYLAVLTSLDNGLEQSYGIHAATNIYGAVIVGYEGAALETDSLFKVNQPSGIYMVASTFMVMILYFIFSKYYFKLTKFDELFIQTKSEKLLEESEPS